MAALVCDICGGKLVMGAGCVAVCDSCGMEHSRDRMREKVQEIKGTVEVSNFASVDSLMKRGYIMLEDCQGRDGIEYGKAYKCFDKVLEINPEYAPAYIGKLFVDISNSNVGRSPIKNGFFAYFVHKEADLAHYYKPLDNMPDYQKAIRYADETYRAKLEGYNNEIKKRIAKLKEEFAFYMIIESTYYCDFSHIRKPSDTGISEYTCNVGHLRDGLEFIILRTGLRYKICVSNNGYMVKNTNWDTFKNGDVAVITHKMHKQQEQERIEKDNQDIEERKAQQFKWQKEQQRIEQWKRQGLCCDCGGHISGFFIEKCRNCGGSFVRMENRIKMLERLHNLLFVIAVIALFISITDIGIGMTIIIAIISIALCAFINHYYNSVKPIIMLILGFFGLIFLFPPLLASISGIVFLLSFLVGNIITIIDNNIGWWNL